MDYNYKDAMTKDVINYIRDHDIKITDRNDRDELEEELCEAMWVTDSVTGNASGSYTFCTNEARRYVMDNWSLAWDAADELGMSNAEMGECLRNEEWETIDVAIRCYMLSRIISYVLDMAQTANIF